MREQDKPRPGGGRPQSNLVINGSHITGFQNLGGAASNQVQAGVINYPEAAYSQNTYEVGVNQLADIAALTSGTSQTNTRFHFHLLQVIDMMNDPPNTVSVIEGYVSTATVTCSKSEYHGAHRSGDAVDLEPGTPGNISNWYTLYRTAVAAINYQKETYSYEMVLDITTDTVPPAGTPTGADLSTNASQLLSRLRAATGPGDPSLTAAPQIQYLDRMRLHVGLPTVVDPGADVRINHPQWQNGEGSPDNGPLLTNRHMRVQFATEGLGSGTEVNFFFFYRQDPAGRLPLRDIRDAASLRHIYGSLDFDLNLIQKHDSQPNALDCFAEWIKKPLQDVDASGHGTIVVDWTSPNVFPSAVSAYYVIAIVAKGKTTAAKKVLSNHFVAGDAPDMPVPKIRETFWSSDASGQVLVLEIQKSASTAYINILSADLPAGYRASVTVRNTHTNQVVYTTTVPLSSGESTAHIPWNISGTGRFHVRIEAQSASETYRLIGGALLRVR